MPTDEHLSYRNRALDLHLTLTSDSPACFSEKRPRVLATDRWLLTEVSRHDEAADLTALPALQREPCGHDLPVALNRQAVDRSCVSSKRGRHLAARTKSWIDYSAAAIAGQGKIIPLSPAWLTGQSRRNDVAIRLQDKRIGRRKGFDRSEARDDASTFAEARIDVAIAAVTNEAEAGVVPAADTHAANHGAGHQYLASADATCCDLHHNG